MTRVESPCYVVAVAGTYRDDISNGYSIRDRIYSGQHQMPHLPGNFNLGTLIQPNEVELQFKLN